jgi:hypothetical protein
MFSDAMRVPEFAAVPLSGMAHYFLLGISPETKFLIKNQPKFTNLFRKSRFQLLGARRYYGATLMRVLRYSSLLLLVKPIFYTATLARLLAVRFDDELGAGDAPVWGFLKKKFQAKLLPRVGHTGYPELRWAGTSLGGLQTRGLQQPRPNGDTALVNLAGPMLLQFLELSITDPRPEHNLLSRLYILMPQVFQVRVISLGRKLRKILKNKRRYRIILSRTVPSQRFFVFCRFVKLFFKFSPAPSHFTRVLHMLLLTLVSPNKSPIFRIYKKQQIGAIANYAKRAANLCVNA